MLFNTSAYPAKINDNELDGYAKSGVSLSRDAASVVVAALCRDAYELEQRGGEANNEAADIQKRLATAIVRALS
jgi:hypothetical protein